MLGSNNNSTCYYLNLLIAICTKGLRGGCRCYDAIWLLERPIQTVFRLTVIDK